MFADANYKRLMLKKARYFIEYNAIDQPDQLSRADAYVTAARAAGVKVLMHISVDDINTYPAEAAEPRRVHVQGRRAHRSLQALRRHRLGSLERGQPQVPADHEEPQARGAVLQGHEAPLRGLQGRRPRRPRPGRRRALHRAAGCATPARRAPARASSSESTTTPRSTAGSPRSARPAASRYPGTKRIIAAVRKQESPGEVLVHGDRRRQAVRNAVPVRREPPGEQDDVHVRPGKQVRPATSSASTATTGTAADCARFDAGLVEADGTLRPAYRTFTSELKNAFSR